MRTIARKNLEHIYLVSRPAGPSNLQHVVMQVDSSHDYCTIDMRAAKPVGRWNDVDFGAGLVVLTAVSCCCQAASRLGRTTVRHSPLHHMPACFAATAWQPPPGWALMATVCRTSSRANGGTKRPKILRPASPRATVASCTEAARPHLEARKHRRNLIGAHGRPPRRRRDLRRPRASCTEGGAAKTRRRRPGRGGGRRRDSRLRYAPPAQRLQRHVQRQPQLSLR